MLEYTHHQTQRRKQMSKLTYRFSLMRNMTENELKEYIKTFTDNDKGMIILAFIKMFQFNVNTNEV